MSKEPKSPPVSDGESKGHPDSGREKTEAEMEKGMPPHQKRGPQPKTDPRPVPDQSPHDR